VGGGAAVIHAGEIEEAVTSPIGLHDWNHRFAVIRALSRGFARPAGPRPLGFGSIGLHGVPIGSIPLQSCSLLVDWQAEENQSCSLRFRQRWRKGPVISPNFAKLWFQFRKPMGEVTEARKELTCQTAKLWFKSQQQTCGLKHNLAGFKA
jgi:hypothetical protein